MKVLKEGKKIEGSMQVTCHTCDAELEIIAADLSKGRPDGGTAYYSYKCPCCKHINYLGYDALTKAILSDMTNS